MASLFKRSLRPAAMPPARPAWADVLASLEDGVIVVDAHGRVTDMNPAAEQLTGFSTVQAASQDLAALLGAQSANQWVAEQVRSTLARSVARRRNQGTLVSRGAEVAVSAACAPVHDTKGRVVGAVLVLHDLTLERTLEAATTRADRLAALSAVAQGLAHEIRNPLGGIKGAAQLLRAALADPEQVHCTDIIIREVERLDGLVEQLRDLSERRRGLEQRPVNIHRVLNDVLALQRRSPDWGGIVLRAEFDPSLPAVLGDRARLTQLFLNLVKNGVEALAGSGELFVATRIESRFHVRRATMRAQLLSVVIGDSGPGIAEEHLPHLFAPFFTTKRRGSGLGLALCHRIVTEHGGTIAYEARRSGGAAFRVTLPTAEEHVDTD